MTNPKRLNSMQALTDDLVRNYELVKSGKMEIAHARALLDTADKVIQGVRTQMAYNAMMQNGEAIPFMGGAKEPPALPRPRLKKVRSKR